MKNSLETYMEKVISKNPSQPEFHQAVREVLESIWDFLEEFCLLYHSLFVQQGSVYS